MTETTVTISKPEYLTLKLAFNLIKLINKSTLNAPRNYIHTNVIDSKLAQEIVLHYDNWVNGSEFMDDDFNKDLETDTKEILKQSLQILVKTVHLIPEDHIGTNHSGFEHVKQAEVNMHNALLDMAELYYKNHENNLMNMKNKMIKDYEDISDEPHTAG